MEKPIFEPLEIIVSSLAIKCRECGAEAGSACNDPPEDGVHAVRYLDTYLDLVEQSGYESPLVQGALDALAAAEKEMFAAQNQITRLEVELETAKGKAASASYWGSEPDETEEERGIRMLLDSWATKVIKASRVQAPVVMTQRRGFTADNQPDGTSSLFMALGTQEDPLDAALQRVQKLEGDAVIALKNARYQALTSAKAEALVTAAGQSGDFKRGMERVIAILDTMLRR